MTLHFAYGSNMSRKAMDIRCPGAEAVGLGVLEDYRFIVMVDGYASVVPSPGQKVHGVLWRLTTRDIGALNAYESLQSGLYKRGMLPVLVDRVHINALVYLGHTPDEGKPRPGYIDQVIEAAREHNLPKPYIEELRRWAPGAWRGPLRRDVGEFGNL